ncbi:phosphatidate cytidylyltransferase [Leptospira sp. 201903070]|uniref:Phosphatidate cytidylyltransferase n=1 Tax=Leptospira ainlahdjerensis TaxID=2810033 RepID=A0ABS2U8G8_9LEPT|nr:phosphatidate cytidylyltransferase [Leptospira ainlahdjerensis]MBM9575843.1 phosphatidate cytidylyltransferase [Leptospira ainlahdjerensis]
MDKEILRILLFIFVGFLGGGVWFFISGRNKDRKERHKRTAKYWSYAGIVVGTTFISTLGGIYWILFCLSVSIGAAFEVGKILLDFQIQFRVVAISIGIIVILLFCVSGLIFSNRVLVFTYLSVAVFDAFSQLTGQSFGKTKMAPRISPNKTWEGFAGGILFATSFGIFFFWVIGKNVIESLPLTFGISILSLSGDLSASWLKRKAKIKDYSNLLPGHGGILDRFDSLIFTLTGLVLLRMVGFFYTKL